MCIHCLHNTCKHQQETYVLIWRIARLKQIHAAVCRNRPVVMLTGTVYALIRLFMEQASKVMLVCDTLHRLHNKLIVIYRNIGCLINRSQLMLCRCNLVVLRFCRHAELPKLHVQILHIGADALFDNAEVMILHLLSFRRQRPEQRASGKHQVFSLHIKIFINKEIFLLRTHRSRYLRRFRIAKQSYDTQRLLAQCLH